MDAELAQVIAQLGAAGLIGWLWLAERRTAAEHERRMRELVERIRSDRVSLSALLEAIGLNTRTLASLESGQRELSKAIDRLAGRSEDRAGTR